MRGFRFFLSPFFRLPSLAALCPFLSPSPSPSLRKKGFHLTEKVSPIKPVPGSSLRRDPVCTFMSNATVCSGRYTIFARPTGLNQFLLLVSVALYDGEQLNLTRITRNEMGAYLCIATNGVPPTVSKRITVDVECEWVLRIYTYRRPTVKIHTSVSLRVRSSSRVYIHAFFLKKKGKKSTSLCLMFAFFFFFC